MIEPSCSSLYSSSVHVMTVTVMVPSQVAMESQWNGKKVGKDCTVIKGRGQIEVSRAEFRKNVYKWVMRGEVEMRD